MHWLQTYMVKVEHVENEDTGEINEVSSCFLTQAGSQTNNTQGGKSTKVKQEVQRKQRMLTAWKVCQC